MALLIGCQEVPSRLPVGGCLEDIHCPRPLRCIHAGRGELGTCGCIGGTSDGEEEDASATSACPGTQRCVDSTCTCTHDIQCPLTQKCIDGQCKCERNLDCRAFESPTHEADGEVSDGADGCYCDSDSGRCLAPLESRPDDLGRGASGLCPTIYRDDLELRNPCGGVTHLELPPGEAVGDACAADVPGARWACVGCDAVACCVGEVFKSEPCCRPEQGVTHCADDDRRLRDRCFDPARAVVDMCGAIVENDTVGACSAGERLGAPCSMDAIPPNCDSTVGDGVWSCATSATDDELAGDSDETDVVGAESDNTDPCQPMPPGEVEGQSDIPMTGGVAVCVPRQQGNACGGSSILTQCSAFRVLPAPGMETPGPATPGASCCPIDEEGVCISDECTGTVTCLSPNGVACDVPRLNPCGTCDQIPMLSRRLCATEDSAAQCQETLVAAGCLRVDGQSPSGWAMPSPEDAPQCFCSWAMPGAPLVDQPLELCRGLGDVFGAPAGPTADIEAGEACGPCGGEGGGTFACVDGVVGCLGPRPNACGGCGPLEGAQGRVYGDVCETMGERPRPGRLRCTADGRGLECAPFTCLPAEQFIGDLEDAGPEVDFLIGEACTAEQAKPFEQPFAEWEARDAGRRAWKDCHERWLEDVEDVEEVEEVEEQGYPRYSCDAFRAVEDYWPQWLECHRGWVAATEQARRLEMPPPPYPCQQPEAEGELIEGGGLSHRRPPPVVVEGAGTHCSDGVWRCGGDRFVCQLQRPNCCGGCQPELAEHNCSLAEGEHPVCIERDGRLEVICALDQDGDGLGICTGPGGPRPCPAVCEIEDAEGSPDDSGGEGMPDQGVPDAIVPERPIPPCILPRPASCVDWLGPDTLTVFDIDDTVPCGGPDEQCCVREGEVHYCNDLMVCGPAIADGGRHYRRCIPREDADASME